MTAERAETYARFQIQGKVIEDAYNPTPDGALAVNTSKNGNSYLRLGLEALVGKYPRKYFIMAYMELADEIGSAARVGDIIQLSGQIELKRNEQKGTWEYTFTARKFALVDQALQNNIEAVKDAFDAADTTDIPF